MKVLFVIPDLGYHGDARQLALLARHLPRSRFEPRVCALNAAGPFAEPISAAGVPVENLGWSRRVDPRPLWRLRNLIRSWRPDVIHAWRTSCLRAALLAGGRYLSRVIVSRPLSPGMSFFMAAARDRYSP